MGSSGLQTVKHANGGPGALKLNSGVGSTVLRNSSQVAHSRTVSGGAVTGVGSGPNSSSEIVNVNNVGKGAAMNSGSTVNATRISRAEEFNGKSSQIGGNTTGTGRVRVQTATGGGRSKRLYEQLNKNLSITASGAMGSGTPQTTVNAPPRGKSSTNASVGNTTSNSLVRSNKTK